MRSPITHPRFWLCVIVLCALTAAAWGGSRSAAEVPHGSGRSVRIYATYYGWFDNTPPGCATAYSGCAGGSGTFADPITFASDRAEFPVGTVLYDPAVHKYFRMGDDCQECDLDWSGHGPDGGPRLHHVDLWIGGRGGNAFDAINCEDALTQTRPNGDPRLTRFIVDPPHGLAVSSAPLFNATTGRCFGGATASTTTGSYRNAESGSCLGRNGHGLGTSAILVTCAGNAGSRPQVTYDGAFLILGHRCLQTLSGRPGSRLDWARCNGNAREQWEINPNRTITWMQYTRCVINDRGRVVLSACRSRPAAHWTFTASG